MGLGEDLLAFSVQQRPAAAALPLPGAVPEERGGLGEELLAFTSAARAQPAQTPAQRGQAIGNVLGLGPGAGDTVPERLALDLAKGAATSTVGRALGRALGFGEEVEELRQLPTSQPIPYFPDMDTLGSLGVDMATFSLLPGAVAPIAGLGARLTTAAGSRVFASAKRMEFLRASLASPSAAHVGLAAKTARDFAGAAVDAARFRAGLAGAQLGRAAATGTAAGAATGGVSLAAGDSPEQALAFGLLGGAALALKPAFQGVRLAGQAMRLSSGRMIETERALAEMLDNGMGRAIALGQYRPGQMRIVARNIADEIAPGMGDDVMSIMDELQIGTPAQGGGVKRFGESIAEMRALSNAWEGVVTSNMIGRLDTVAKTQGMGATAATFRSLFTSVDQSLRKAGPAGVRLANKITKARTTADRLSGRYRVESGLDELLQASDDEWTAFHVAREAGDDVPQKFRKLAGYLDNEAADQAKLAGAVIPDELAGRYMPHLYDTDKLKDWIRVPANRDKLGKALGVPEGRFHSVFDEVDRLVKAGEEGPIQLLQTSFDFRRRIPLTFEEIHKLGMPIGDPRAVLQRYFRQLADRVSITREFGAAQGGRHPGFESLLREVTTQGGAARYSSHMTKMFEDSSRLAAGITYSQAGSLSHMARWLTNNIVVPSKLTLAVVSNSSQSVNTIAKLGFRNYARGLRDMRREAKLLKSRGVSNPEVQMARQIWAITAEISGDIPEMLTGLQRGAFNAAREGESVWRRANLGSWVLDKTGFSAVERFNRLSAAYAGKHWMRDVVEKAQSGALKGRDLARARRDFSKLGLDLNRIQRVGITADEVLDGAIRLSDLTQFRVKALDLPHWWSSPNASVFRLLKTFAFNQSRFVKNVIGGSVGNAVRSGSAKDLRPLAFFAAGYPIAGMGVGSTRHFMKTGEFDPFLGRDSMTETYAAALSWVGGVGLLQDIGSSFEGGMRTVGELAGGPLVSDAIALTEAGIRSIKQGDARPLGLALTRMAPGVGQNLFGSRDAVREVLDLN